ncbi:MAG: esterase-like activity of phytase family protein [bacterium]
MRVALALGALISVSPAHAQHWAIEDPGQGPVALAPGDVGAHELSGLAWAGGERYYAVSDNGGRLLRLRIEVEPAHGTVRYAAVDGVVRLALAKDLEGVAMGPDGTSVFVTDEVGPALREYSIADGHPLRSARVPALFTKSIRSNLGFEALARDAHGVLWTANEDALRVDGPTSSTASGSWVRVQRFDASLQATGQWAYWLDAVDGAMVLPSRGTGLSELVALPDGRLLALERSLSLAGLRIRLYEVELGAATDVSTLPGLVGAHFTPLKKHLLWERTFLHENFEGAALGARLGDGSHSLLLIADDGHDLSQALYALRLRRR